MYERSLKPPKTSFFLFGPRGVGKSTWLKENFPEAVFINFLRASEFLRYQKNPSLLSDEVKLLKPRQWVIIDEVQKLPAILDEVHSIIFESNGSINFALTGSSARKLKRSHANMLAGRALTKKMFALSYNEISDHFELNRALRYGQLPASVVLKTNAERVEFLDAYVETYLKEEIQQEALVRNLAGFRRFLEVAAIMNGQILSISNVARDVGVARSTVQGYFEILEDTLLAWQLPALRVKAKVKEVAHPKFYFFDCGVQRGLLSEQRTEPSRESLGHLFETFILNEIRAINSYFGLGAEMSYWRTEHGTEVDLILSFGSNRKVGIEIKYKDHWEKSDSRGLETLLEKKIIHKAYGIFLGPRPMKRGEISILPWARFLKEFKEYIS